jgi:hypothetical protein
MPRRGKRFSFDNPGATLKYPTMPWPADYHMHTPLCRHATGEPPEYAARALAGLEKGTKSKEKK